MKQAAALAVAAVAGLAAAGAARAETVYLTAARMIDPVAGKTVERPAVVIENDRVKAVGTTASLPAPAGARLVDLGAQTILPGLIDMHVHMTARADQGGYNSVSVIPVNEAISGVANAWKTLQAGFTTVRNVGAGGFSDVALRDSINAGETIGPRMFVAGPALGATGGHCDDNLLPYGVYHKVESVADGPWEFRAKVRQVRKFGADLIKICASGGVLSKGDSVGAQQISLEEITAIVTEAHALGMKVAAHAHGTEAIKDAIRAGVDTIEHASLADEEAFKLAKAKGAAFDMDIYNDDFILNEGAKNGILPESLEKERMIGLKQRQTFQAAQRAGVTMTFGTDAGVYPHGDNGRQFAKEVQWGMTPMQAIQSATVTAAQRLGDLGKGLGEIAPGAYADIIAVDGDPLADVSRLEHVAFVMKGGVVYKGPGAISR